MFGLPETKRLRIIVNHKKYYKFKNKPCFKYSFNERKVCTLFLTLIKNCLRVFTIYKDMN